MLGPSYIHRYNEQVKRLFAAKGGEGMDGLAPELVPVVVLEDDHVETQRYKSVLTWFGWCSMSGAVGQTAGISVMNPASSGLIVVVEAFIPLASAPGQINFAINPAGYAPIPQAGQQTLPRDTRWGSQLPATVVGGAQGAAPAAQVGLFGVLANTPYVIPLNWVLKPGHFLTFFAAAVNTGITGNFFGYERPAEATELV